MAKCAQRALPIGRLGSESSRYDRRVPAATVTLDDVYAARERIGERLVRTPMLASDELSRETGANVLLKAELFQRTGSFKPRGVLSKLATLTPDERARGLLGVSAGNHAMAIAYGAALEQLDALVVMWASASELKIAETRRYGATVDLEAPGPAAAFARIAELQRETRPDLDSSARDPYTSPRAPAQLGWRSSKTRPRSRPCSSPSAAAA